MNLFTMLIILDIDQTPFESCWKSSWILLYILDMFELVNWAFLKWGGG